MKYEIYITIIFFLAMTIPAFAKHNSHLKIHNPNRGYNKENCEKLIGKINKEKGLWLGHEGGCKVDNVIKEYTVEPYKSYNG